MNRLVPTTAAGLARVARAGRLSPVALSAAFFGLAMLVAEPVAAEVAASASAISPDSPIYRSILSSPLLESMFMAARKTDFALRLQLDCRERVQVEPRQLIFLSPVDLPDERTYPVKGSWLVRYDLVRCGDAKRYNAVFVADAEAKPDGLPRLSMLFPGLSLASPRLLGESAAQVMVLARRSTGDPDCGEAVLADMRVDQPPHRVESGNESHDNVWNETWTFYVCGRSVDAAVTFTPTPRDGGTDWSVRFPSVDRARAASEFR